MRPPRVTGIPNASNIIMEGVFVVKDNTSVKERKSRKCRVGLQTNRNEVILHISDAESSSNNEVENKVFVAETWLVYSAQTDARVASLALVKASAFDETLVLETTSRNNSVVLKKMECILRETLKVASFDITIQEMLPDRKTSQGVIHIFRDKVVITQGFLPDLREILSRSLHPRDKDWLQLADTQGIHFCSNPDFFVLSDHRDDIWKTLQGCLKSAKSSHHYINLPFRPRRYIYMNLADNEQAPCASLHNYVNIFNMSGAIYQNFHKGGENMNRDDGVLPPRCPPRRPLPLVPPTFVPPTFVPPPLVPPRQTRPINRPPKSPLPAIPKDDAKNDLIAPALPPWPRPKKPIGKKELQCIVYCSKPVVGQFWVIQVIFLQTNDFITLQRIKKLEEESNYQLLKPLPEYIKITGDSKISLLEIESGCTLKSEAEQIVEFQVVSESVRQSCWMIFEFHLEHNEQMKRNFHAKIIIQPNSTRSVLMERKEILISANFQVESSLHPIASTCRAFKDIGVQKYLKLCDMLDMPCALRNDWTGLAGEVGLNIEQVFKIQSKAMFPNFSPTNEVLNIWSHKQDSTCGIDELRVILKKLQRFDVLDYLC